MFNKFAFDIYILCFAVSFLLNVWGIHVQWTEIFTVLTQIRVFTRDLE